MVFEQKKITSDAKLIVNAYNFSGKTVGGYVLAYRLYDANGKALAERYDRSYDYETTGVFQQPCGPKRWCELEVLRYVPEEAVKAKIIPASLSAVNARGAVEADPFFFDVKEKWPFPN